MTDQTVDLDGEAKRLALASVDMRQAAAAARLLQKTPYMHEARGLETAIAVCYWRPFSQSNQGGALKKKWEPTGPEGKDVHAYLRRLRNEVHAHTDPKGGRTASITVSADQAGRQSWRGRRVVVADSP